MRPHPSAIILLVSVLAVTGPVVSGAEVDYIRDVKPIFVKHCFACHGALRTEAGLRLDTGTAILRGGKAGVVVKPGADDSSPLIERVTSRNESERMPKEGAALTAGEVETLRAWVKAGASYPADEPAPPDPFRHWSFVPPARPELPPEATTGTLAGSRHPIDRLVAAEQAKMGVRPVGVADRYTLLRRVTVDLTGLLPTRDEIDAFVKDESPDAYERVVDRLLASPAYAQRWARNWMDVWRYSDFDGYNEEVRESHPHIWRWRDWIVESLRDDKPYDRMVTEMLAGDEVAPTDPGTLRATGFLARNYNKFDRNAWLDNTVEHTAKAFLGLTVNCARCHDHKYDPISQVEYYRLRAVFEPYEVRVDPSPDSTAGGAGLLRVYDAKPETPTYLFLRGNDKTADTKHPLACGAPRAAGDGELKVLPVSLPPGAFYPGLTPQAQAAAAQAAEKELSDARAKLAKVEEAKPAATALSLEQAKLGVEVSEAKLAFEWARRAADRVKYAAPPAPADEVASASWASVAAERRWSELTAREAVLSARIALDAAGRAKDAKPDEAKLVELRKKLKEAEEKHAKACEALAAAPAGDYTALGPTYPKTSTGRRTALAKFIADPHNPLTARVAVNHVWLRHMNAPLVPTVFDFGHNGKPPVNQRLLDWLAVELMENGWHMKPIHRLIVTSRTYQLQSAAAASGDVSRDRQLDPDNAYLWRMNPRRVEAEAIRDGVLQLAGRLDPSPGGPDLDPKTADAVPRRSLYFRHSKEKWVMFLQVFDQASVVDCYRRDASIVPQQALAMANSELTAAAAPAITAVVEKRTGSGAGGGEDAFVAEAFLTILGRPARDAEAALCRQYLHKGMSRERLVHSLLNHNDFVTTR